jgi:hypothetical protein
MHRNRIIRACAIAVVAAALGAFLVRSLWLQISKMSTSTPIHVNGGGDTYKVIVVSQPPDPWFHASVIIAGIVAAAGIIALLMVRQQVVALVNSERAWVDGHLIWHRSLDFDLDIVNHGKTPAHLQTYWVEIGSFNKKGEYEFPYKTSNNIDTLCGSGEMHHVPEVKLASFFAQEKVSGKEGVMLRVRIKYWDIVTITDRKRRPRWTTFICDYNRKTNDITRLRHETKYE